MTKLGLDRWMPTDVFTRALGAPRVWVSRISTRGYRLIIAASVIGLLFLEAVQANWVLQLLTAAGVLCYVGYVVLRMAIPARWEDRYYKGRIQFWRAQAGILGVTLLLGAFALFREANALWILYVLGLMIVSQHCRTFAVLFTMGEVGILLIFLGLVESGLPPHTYFRLSPNLLLALFRSVSIVLVGFLVHYLVQKLSARDESIAHYREMLDALAENTRSLHSPGVARSLVLRLCSGIRDADCASIWLLDAQSGRLTLAACAQENCDSRRCLAKDGQEVSLLPQDDRLPARVVAAQEPCVASSTDGVLGLPDVQRAPRPFLHDATLEIGLAIPDFQAHQAASSAVLCVGFRRRMNAVEVRRAYGAVREITQGLSPVLYYASLLEQYQALQQLGSAVTHSLKLDRVLGTLLTLVTRVFGFDFATVSLVDEEEGVIRTVRGENVPEDWVEVASHPLTGNDIQADVVRNGQIEVLAGWDERFDREIWERFGHKDMLRIFLPMSVMDPATGERKCIGTLEAGYRQAQEAHYAQISEAQVDLLRPFVDQAAVAVAKARLYEEMQQLYEETRQTAEVLTALHHGGQAIQSAMWDHERLLREIGRSAEKVLGADLVLLFDYDEARHQAELLFIGGDVRGKGRPAPRLDQGNILDAIIAQRRPFYYSDAQAEPLLVDYGEPQRRGHRTFTQRQEVASFAGLPLMSGGELMGIMCVNYRAHRSFPSEECRIIELFAQQAAVALKSDRLRKRERQLLIAQERATLSRELHCSVTTELFAIGLKVETALHHLGKDQTRVRTEMEDIWEMVTDAKHELGYLVSEFDADDAEEDFPTVLKETVERIRRFYDIRVQCRGRQTSELSSRTHFALSRIAKEALNNVIRHSDCGRVEVIYAITPVAASLQIVDDGKGFRLGRVIEKSERLGIKNMQRYADSVRGELNIESAPGRGTVVSLRVPRPGSVEGGVYVRG